MKQQIALKIGGDAGQGVKSSGYIITKALKDLGYWTFSYSEYPSLIRGGHSTFQINIDTHKIFSVTQEVDILLALNEETIKLHYQEIHEGGILICDDDIIIEESIKKLLQGRKVTIITVTVNEIVEKNGGQKVMENSVIMGSVWSLLSDNISILQKQIEKNFGEKGKDTEINLKCAQDGFDYIKKNNHPSYSLKQLETKNRIIGTGNEVAGLSIYASGVRLFAAYPMTPATGIYSYLAPRAPKFKMIVKQAEDEISAVQMVIGANHAGTRATCATSGGGLALMTETISLSGITEIPLVIFDSQRPAPATGMPTWTEQGDLGFVSKIGHGDFPRIIIAPGDIDEVFYLTPRAFNMSEEFQIPVIILLDKYLSESWYQTEKFTDKDITVKRGQIISKTDLLKETDYKRYKNTVSGVSPRSLPGMNRGVFLANSDEHDESGYSSEDKTVRKQMMEKRMSKLAGMRASIPEPILYGPKNAKTTIVCWGSQKGPVIDALEVLNKDRAQVNALHYSFVLPLRSELLLKLSKTNKLISVENNYSSQFASLLREETGITIETKITKYVGTPFFKDELIEILQSKLDT